MKPIKKSLEKESIAFGRYISPKKRMQIKFVNHPDVNESIVCHLYQNSESCLYINMGFLNKLDYEFAILVSLHEIYHFNKQGIVSKGIVNLMRDRHSWILMQLCDVEADLIVPAYLKKKWNLSFESYLKIYHRGISVYHDKEMRMPKLERFIGSMLSIRNLLEYNEKVVFLPQLHLNSTSLVIVDFSENYLGYKKFNLYACELKCLKYLFQNASLTNESDYIKQSMNITDKILSRIRLGRGD